MSADPFYRLVAVDIDILTRLAERLQTGANILVGAVLVIVLALAGCTPVSFDSRKLFQPWDSIEISEAGALAGLEIGDGVTSSINITHGHCTEIGPIESALFGGKPSEGDFVIGLAASYALWIGVAEVLPHAERKVWLLAPIGVETYAVTNNLEVMGGCRE